MLSERFARFMGTAVPRLHDGFVLLWIVWNIVAPADLRFDSYPFIFLTLMLSLQASYAAPLILLAQNRQADRDRVALEQDRARDERNLADTEFLTREIAALRIALREVATRDFVRSELRNLLEELEERSARRAPARPGATPRHDPDGARPARHRPRPATPGQAAACRAPARDLRMVGHADAAAQRDAMLAALSKVNDPEIRKPITELGMVESVEVDDARPGRRGDLADRLGLPA